jgi:hypothetical protein
VSYWHKAFIAAMQIELENYSEFLDFHDEFQLTQEPLRIDLRIIKKNADVEIKHSIGRFFRGHNIIEFKSRTDYISRSDFFKVCAYGLLYLTLEKPDYNDVTLTLISNKHPRSVFKILHDKGYKINNPANGVYNIDGFLLPIQIINTSELSDEDNFWLYALNNECNITTAEKILTLCGENMKDEKYSLYLQTIMTAEEHIFEEVAEMSKKRQEQAMYRIFMQDGVAEDAKEEIMQKGIEKGVEKGMQKGILDTAKNFLCIGLDADTVSKGTGLPIETVRNLQGTVHA